MNTNVGMLTGREADPNFHPAVAHVAEQAARGRSVATQPAEMAPLVPTYAFSTDALPLADRFDAWRRSFAPMVDLSRETRGNFSGSQDLWDLGGLAFSRIKTGALRYSCRPAQAQSHPLDHWVMTLLLSGHSSTTTSNTNFVGRPGVVQIHTLGRKFQGTMSDSEMLMLWVPRDFCRDMAGVLDAAEFTTLDTAMGRMFTTFMIGLSHQVTCMRVDELPRLMSAAREMIVACVAPNADRLDEVQGTLVTLRLEKARQFIQKNLYNPKLGPEMLMRELAISRTRLYRLFEPAGGVNRYIQHRRLLDAHSALADPNEQRRILEIAEQRGFDGAEFSRAFKREFGYSPSDVRRGERIGRPSYASESMSSLPPEEWLGALLWRLQNERKAA